MKFLFSVFLLFLSLVVSSCSNVDSAESVGTDSVGGDSSEADIFVYKSPTCGCCKTWITHLKEEGFNVTSQDVEDVTPYKDKYGVPRNMSSCHTALREGYVIEGHVPAWDIERMLKEKPDIIGLTVPRMPRGTPGMEMNEQNDKKDPYEVLAIKKDGTSYVFTSYPNGGNKKEDGVPSRHR